MAYLSRMVNGKRQYSDFDRRIKAINRRMQTMYQTLGESSDAVSIIENEIQRQLNSRFKLIPGKMSNSRVRVEGARLFVSRSNAEYAGISDIELDVALDAIEAVMNKHPLRKEVSRIKKELASMGIAGSSQPLFGSKKRKPDYSISQIKGYNDLAANANSLIEQAKDYFYRMDRLADAGELNDRYGNPLSADPEYSMASDILHQSKKTYVDFARVIELAAQLDDRLDAAGAMEGDPNSQFFAQTPYTYRRNANRSGYKGSPWEAWDKLH